MANIFEVAKVANVSTTLVSRVINNQKGVGPEKKDRILKAIQELNYKPNELARSLVRQKTDTIGAIIAGLSTPITHNLIDAIDDGCYENDYNIIFADPRHGQERNRKTVDYFLGGRVDGIILFGSQNADDHIVERIMQTDVPVVLIENDSPAFDVFKVVVDNFKGGYQATEHLISLGKRDILHLAGDFNVRCAVERLNGFVAAMRDHHISIREGRTIISNFSVDAGYYSMREVLRSGNIPEAVFAGSDTIAFGAMRAMMDAGLRVPQDVSIVGFDDDIPLDREIRYPSLTTIRQPFQEMGTVSVQLLIEAIQNPSCIKRKEVLETELIIRESCGQALFKKQP